MSMKSLVYLIFQERDAKICTINLQAEEISEVPKFLNSMKYWLKAESMATGQTNLGTTDS